MTTFIKSAIAEIMHYVVLLPPPPSPHAPSPFRDTAALHGPLPPHS